MASSVHRKILEAVRDAIIELALEDVPDSNVVIWKETKRQERIEVGSLPCIAVMHSGESEQYNGPATTNVMHTIGFPVAVLICDLDRDTGKPDHEYEHDKRLYWRERIVARFLDQALDPSIQVCYCTMSNRQVMLPQEWFERSIWISPLLFYFWGRINTSSGALYAGVEPLYAGAQPVIL